MTTLKKIFSLVLVICMLATVFSITACGNKDKNNDNNENNGVTDNGGNENATTDKTYTVTVLDGDNVPVEGVKLVITDGKSYPTATSDKDGKASVVLPEATTVNVMVTSVPNGYIKPEKVSGVYHGVFASGSTEFTLKVEKEADDKIEYTVKVVDQNGDAVVGMSIQLCPNGVCLAEKFVTDANGEITVKLNAGSAVDVKLEALEGYVLPVPVNDPYHAVIASGETEITITVTKN